MLPSLLADFSPVPYSGNRATRIIYSRNEDQLFCKQSYREFELSTRLYYFDPISKARLDEHALEYG